MHQPEMNLPADRRAQMNGHGTCHTRLQKGLFISVHFRSSPSIHGSFLCWWEMHQPEMNVNEREWSMPCIPHLSSAYRS
jgi:hypothetical protein